MIRALAQPQAARQSCESSRQLDRAHLDLISEPTRPPVEHRCSNPGVRKAEDASLGAVVGYAQKWSAGPSTAPRRLLRKHGHTTTLARWRRSTTVPIPGPAPSPCAMTSSR